MILKATITATAGAAIVSLAISSAGAAQESEAPPWLRVMSETTFDGQSNDLVTGGFGVSGMIEGPDLSYADPLAPTAEELRRVSIVTDGSTGFGTIYGPTIDASTGEPLDGDGKVAGTEYLAYADDGPGQQNVAFLLQVPESFDRESPCILAVPVSGSNSLFRNVGNIGYWGLQKNCAVVYSDKGLGNGFHDLASDTVTLIDGTRAGAEDAGRDSHFTADGAAREAFLEEFPHRIAFKHAHSKQNPDATWGRDVVRSIEFAMYQLNATPEKADLTPENTLVIVTGNSNGGGAALYAGEVDEGGLIDGIVAAQPQVQLDPDERVTVKRGNTVRKGTGRPLLDYFTYAILYQPCAAAATPDAPWADRVMFAENRCESLIERGLVEAKTAEEAAQESLEKLRDYGWEPESDMLHASHYVIAPTATAMKYANSQGRFGVEERLCGYSIASVDEGGHPQSAPPEELARIFAVAPGGAPTGTIDVVNDRDPRGPTRDFISQSPSTGLLDFNLDGAVCLRELVTGDSPEARRVQQGIDEVTGDADLHGTPTIIVHGRADARVPIGFTSRPYLGLNSLTDGAGNLHLYELTNVEHFSAGLPGYAERFVPIDPYHIDALELMYAHLTEDAPLPPSQVVRPEVTADGAGEAGIGLVLPTVAASPDAADAIEVTDGQVTVPD
ncbi:D-(-)-3-hydroxybutyrate oligomer hydrolase [Halomonas sp. MCCC 1A11036]|uniref:D-(-)-3-hydroxybutyrate oligomer hydrolase n=1 Tax=Billgrantia zhangzhouensis TaxID=2733481 RepID=A0ABS9ACL4_9GAMM|nr:D-(-)-3-hydroxybutyrate oligomer hydrolase [Halomonas zhangzhouensis]MCE8019332.1 D-(-)-3-hydroxybutyrate oligomer hydrolase [Halomonas zhangzhouensis]